MAPKNGTRPARGRIAAKTIRLRDKDHRQYVSRQPCLVCGRTPADAHHLRFAQPRALGRKVSDEFTVPVCRVHHRELHRHGDEASWWQSIKLDPLPIARRLWQRERLSGLTHINGDTHPQISTAAATEPHVGSRDIATKRRGQRRSGPFMTSFRQIEANRRNALRSTGPITEEGKRRSRRNAAPAWTDGRNRGRDGRGY